MREFSLNWKEFKIVSNIADVTIYKTFEKFLQIHKENAIDFFREAYFFL